MFYQKWMEEQAQKLVDATARAFTQGRMSSGQGAAPRMPMVWYLFSEFFRGDVLKLFQVPVATVTIRTKDC